MSEIVKVENVTKYFKQEKVLDDVNMNLETGHIYGIVGKNGAGKTVLFKIIAGFIKPSSGKVTVAGKIIGVDRDFPDSLGLIIETPGFLSQYNAYQNLLYFHAGQFLTMAGLFPESLAALHFADEQLGAFCLSNDFAGHRGAFHKRFADRDGVVIGDHQNFVENDFGALVACQFFDQHDIAFADLVLLRPCFNDCVHNLILRWR